MTTGRGVIWTIASAMLAVVLYVASWPVIDIRYGLNRPRIPVISSISRPAYYSRKAWAETLYAPLLRWQDSNGERNVAHRYWNWWRDRLLVIP